MAGRLLTESYKCNSSNLDRIFGNDSARVDSDYDLLIVWRDENPPAARAAAIRRVLLNLGKPLDIAVVTPQEYERFRNRRAHIVAIAGREGSVLHAA
jgi:hypothetical protein